MKFGEKVQILIFTFIWISFTNAHSGKLISNAQKSDGGIYSHIIRHKGSFKDNENQKLDKQISKTISYILLNYHDSLSKIIFVYDQASKPTNIIDSIQENPCINRYFLIERLEINFTYQTNLTSDLESVNIYGFLMFVVFGSTDFINSVLEEANSIDLTLNQQGYFTSHHKWILVPENNCNSSINYLSKLTNVICIETEKENDDYMNRHFLEYDNTIWQDCENRMRPDSLLPISTAMFGQTERYWQRITAPYLDQSNIYPNMFSGFNKQYLRITSMYWPNYIAEAKLPNGDTKIIGMYADIIETLSIFLNFTYDIVIPDDLMWGSRNDDGSWTGMVGMLQRREVDFAVAALSASALRKEVMDFADIALQQTFVTGIYKKPEAIDGTFMIFIIPFKLEVWFIIGLVIILIAVVFTFMKFVDRQGNRNERYKCKLMAFVWEFLLNLEYTLGGLIIQSLPETKHMTRGSQRFLMGAFWMFCLCTVTLWKGELISHLSVSLEEIPVKTLDDMLNQKQYTYGVLGGTLAHDSLQRATHGQEALIWERMSDFHKKDDIVLSADHDAKMRRVKEGGYIYIEEYEAFAKIVSLNCDLALMDEKLYPLTYSVGMPRNSAFKDTINRFSLKLHDSGIMTRLISKYFLDNATCTQERAEYNHGPVLLPQVAFLFYFLAIAVFIAFVLLSIEITICPALRLRQQDVVNTFCAIRVQLRAMFKCNS